MLSTTATPLWATVPKSSATCKISKLALLMYVSVALHMLPLLVACPAHRRLQTQSIVNAFAKLNMKTVVSEANEQHLQDWPEILAKSTPPITNPPINPTMPPEELSKHGASFDGSKLRQLTGWKPKAPKLTQDAVKEVLDQWRAEEGVWPNAPQK